MNAKPLKEARNSRPVRMTDAEWAKCKALGGAAFIRAKIKAENESVSEVQLDCNMKTLQEHNKEREQSHDQLRKRQEPHANGIACPKCGEELWDSNPMMTLSSNPPKKNVHCLKCGYIGYRLA